MIGLALETIKMYLNLMEEANHDVLLGGTPSQQRYSHSQHTLIIGSGQGTKWAGPSWFSISEIILDALQSNQQGLKLESPDIETTDERHAEMCVENSRQGVNNTGVMEYSRKNGSSLTLPEAATKTNQSFERHLSLTGGS